jgi:hypothetical protein
MTEVNAPWLHPGFSRDSVLNYLFKKAINRVDTSVNISYYKEATGQTNLFLDYLATDVIPPTPPDDFVTLNSTQISTIFGINESEIAEFNTTINGESVFSIEQSVSKPHVLRINNLLMKPNQANINGSFSGFTSRSRVNLVAQTIHSSYGSGGYKCIIKRSAGGGELSINGNDIVNIHNLGYIFDGDNGILTLHEEDSERLSTNYIRYTNPPVFSCYVYRGNYGRLGWHIQNNAIVLDETQLLLGKQSVTDPTLIMDVSGAAFISELTCESIATFSDIRLKENISVAPVNRKILELKPAFYEYKSKPGIQEYGLIAQEVEKAAPEIVKPAGDFLSVQYDRLGVYLIPIVKEQQERIEKLESQVDALLKFLTKA